MSGKDADCETAGRKPAVNNATHTTSERKHRPTRFGLIVPTSGLVVVNRKVEAAICSTDYRCAITRHGRTDFDDATGH